MLSAESALSLRHVCPVATIAVVPGSVTRWAESLVRRARMHVPVLVAMTMAAGYHPAGRVSVVQNGPHSQSMRTPGWSGRSCKLW
jgi:hypothetical protein